jgi:hypothetical protein
MELDSGFSVSISRVKTCIVGAYHRGEAGAKAAVPK